jgi:uncharacterized protein YecE (DUF72 family)
LKAALRRGGAAPATNFPFLDVGNCPWLSEPSAVCFPHRLWFLFRVPRKGSIRSKSGKILVGTASWSDPGFVQHWYPKGVRAHERLGWYAQQFEMVEVNSTFYSVPDRRLVERWCQSTPETFTFDVKLHQLLSRHSTAAKLLPPNLQQRAEINANGKVTLTPELEEALVDALQPSMSILRGAGKLGTLLLQLSPAFSPRMHRLEELEHLIDMLSDYRLAIEFRNRNWVTGDQLRLTTDFLKRRGAAFVNVDAPFAEHFTIMPSNLNEITNPRLTYLRLHGRNARAYITGKTVAARFNYDYRDNEIRDVAERSRRLAREADEVHVIFNNNALDYAPRAAARLRTALGQIIPARPETAELF